MKIENAKVTIHLTPEEFENLKLLVYRAWQFYSDDKYPNGFEGLYKKVSVSEEKAKERREFAKKFIQSEKPFEGGL